MEDIKIITSPTAEECEVILGHELNENEAANYSLFLAVATARLNAFIHADINDLVDDNNLFIVKTLLARLIGVISDEQEDAKNRGVIAKTVEDFKVEYDENSSTPMRHFVDNNADFLRIFMPKSVIRAGSTAYDGKALCI